MPEKITPQQAAALVPDGATVMLGGFLGCGSPHTILEALIARDAKNLTLIGNDTASPGFSVARLVEQKRVKKLIVSHIGTNPASGAQLNEGTLEVDLVPQGSLAERIRSAGAGLGGFLTPTGVGTPVEEGKRKINIDGRDYLLELPLRADVALIRAWKADEAGNLVYRLAARNFNPLMATAAALVIAEAEEIVPVGALDPDQIHTPAIFVNHLVQA
ncbi:MAG: 3-oxoacid CoA-transferase subunit A [Deltaproteobacteria bacterium]|jgi:acetate CoA/acetoacetate CoA-transferase alpha subunit|nr:3-oxoacid CoA-transferase subunit A [Deltaproteobacteria bacterium]